MFGKEIKKNLAALLGRVCATVDHRMLYFPNVRSLFSFWLQRIAILRCIVFGGRSDCVFNEVQLWAGFR